MKEVTLNIGGRPYRLTVPENQHARLQTAATRIDTAFETLRRSAPDMERDRVMVLAALQMADDMLQHQAEREQEQSTIAAFNATLAEKLEKLAV
ncbi:MAG: cell division protein ZapA [Alphaproteobacteria bacterium]